MTFVEAASLTASWLATAAATSRLSVHASVGPMMTDGTCTWTASAALSGDDFLVAPALAAIAIAWISARSPGRLVRASCILQTLALALAATNAAVFQFLMR